METSLGWVQHGKKVCCKAWKKIQLGVVLEVKKMLKSNITLRIRAVPGSSVADPVTDTEGFQKVSLSCHQLLHMHQRLCTKPAPRTFCAGCLSAGENSTQSNTDLLCFCNLIISWWPFPQVTLHQGWTEHICPASCLALQLIALHPEEERRKRQ